MRNAADLRHGESVAALTDVQDGYRRLAEGAIRGRAVIDMSL